LGFSVLNSDLEIQALTWEWSCIPQQWTSS